MRVEDMLGMAKVARQILAVGAMADDMVTLIRADVEQGAGDGAAPAGEWEGGRHGRSLAFWLPMRKGLGVCLCLILPVAKP